MTRYVYLHGFNSGFTLSNPKIIALAELGEVIPVTYDSLATFSMILADIQAQLPDYEDDLVLVGTSLGAYFAAQVSYETGIPAVLINPCIDPTNSLQKYVGQVHTNYVTGESGYFDKNTLSTYAGEKLPVYLRLKPLVFVDLADEVIPAQETIDYFATKGVAVTAFEGGSHQFDHMTEALQQIAAYASYTSFLP